MIDHTPEDRAILARGGAIMLAYDRMEAERLALLAPDRTLMPTDPDWRALVRIAVRLVHRDG